MKKRSEEIDPAPLLVIELSGDEIGGMAAVVAEFASLGFEYDGPLAEEVLAKSKQIAWGFAEHVPMAIKLVSS